MTSARRSLSARASHAASFLAALCGAVIMTTAPAARAGDVEDCVKAAELGQSARRTDGLLRAREHLITCARETCPRVIRSDCARWLDDVEARLPAASIRVTSDDGHDLPAKITIDGAGSSEPAGKSHPLDPGDHVFRAEAEGFQTAEQKVVLAQGEKARVVTLVLKAKVARRMGPEEPPPKVDDRRGPHPVVYPVAIIGVLGLASFTYFGLTGRSEASDLRDGCGKTSSCSRSDVDAASAKYLVADVSLGVGLLALGAAAILWFTTHDD